MRRAHQGLYWIQPKPYLSSYHVFCRNILYNSFSLKFNSRTFSTFTQAIKSPIHIQRCCKFHVNQKATMFSFAIVLLFRNRKTGTMENQTLHSKQPRSSIKPHYILGFFHEIKVRFEKHSPEVLFLCLMFSFAPVFSQLWKIDPALEPQIQISIHHLRVSGRFLNSQCFHPAFCSTFWRRSVNL